MLFKCFNALIIAASASAIFTMEAAANPRFTVESDSELNVEIEIFSGDDSTCIVPDKFKKLKSGKTKTFGCEGNGTGRCKVRVVYKNIRVCGNANKACGGTAIRVKDGKRLVLSDDDGCYVE